MRPVVGPGVSTEASPHLGARRDLPAPDITDDMADSATRYIRDHTHNPEELLAMLGLVGPVTTPATLKAEGQEQSLGPVSEQTRRVFLAVICSARPGAQVSVNDYRDLLDQADIPNVARGGLWNLAVNRGYLTVLRHPDGSPRLIPSTGPSAHQAHVRVYQRTRKE